MVERDLPKIDVASSILVFRSNYSLAFFLVAFGLGAGYTAGTPTALAFLPFFIIPLIYFLPFLADMNRPVFGSRFNVTRLAESSPTNF